MFLQLSIRPNKNQSVSTRIWKLNNLLPWPGKSRYSSCSPEHSIRLNSEWNEKYSRGWFCLQCQIYGDMKFSGQPDKIHCRPGKVITVFVSFKVGKPPINIVFFIYRVFNNGTYPIVFSINSYVSVYSPDAPLLYTCSLYSAVRRRNSSPEVSWTSSNREIRQDLAQNVDGW